jgi:hypothetical protein
MTESNRNENTGVAIQSFGPQGVSPYRVRPDMEKPNIDGVFDDMETRLSMILDRIEALESR